MSKSTNEYTIPVRWSAPEVLKEGRFTLKADVFSFYVVLWEIFEYGKVPYGWESSNQDIYNLVLAGKQLPKPAIISDELYQIMRNCAKMQPEERPDFSEILKQLKDMQTPELIARSESKSDIDGYEYSEITNYKKTPTIAPVNDPNSYTFPSEKKEEISLQ